MKKTLALAAILLLCTAAHAQYTWSNPQPSGYANTSITFTDNAKGFLFNAHGELFKTADTGNTWQLQQRFPYAMLLKLKDSVGVIAGGRGTLYVSSDKGLTWQQKKFDSSLAIDFIDIVHSDTFFVTASETGTWRKLFRSVDRGNTWQLVNDTHPFMHYRLEFVTSKIGFHAVGSQGIYKTRDGGTTWTLVNSITTSSGITCIQFADTLKGYAYRESNGMLRTTDGGLSWQTSTGANEDVTTISIINGQVAYAAGEWGCAYKTIDGGATWNWIGIDGLRGENDLLAQYFFNESTGLMTGLRGRILKTTDGGASFKTLSPTYIDMTAISMASNNTGYATNWNNVYKTTDAGKSWQVLPLVIATEYADNSRFNHCVFFNADTGILTSNGNVSRLYRTVNGGQSFDTIKIQSQFGQYEINGLSFVNSTTGYSSIHWTTTQQLLMKTTDGGIHWQQISDDTDIPQSIQFVNEQTGFGVRHLDITRTMDSGKTWSQLHYDGEGRFTSLWFINAQKGFVVGEYAMLKMTTDSGRTWQKITFENYYEDFIKVRFYGESVGYITVEDGSYYKTINGGLTWRKAGNIAFHDCPAIAFTGDSSVYIAGQYGTIVKTSIPEFLIDSLLVNLVTACRAGFSAKITAELSTVDSTWFEYGTNNFGQSVVASPGAVTNGVIKATIPSQLVSMGTSYKVRVKILYRGKYYFSEEKLFNTDSILTPTITVNNSNLLISSADSGNQWYRNDTLIQGATGKSYTATISGIYKVRVVSGNCTSSFSALQFVVYTGIIDPVLNAELNIYPNPIDAKINIYNEKLRSLSISVMDITGHRLMHLQNIRQQLITFPATKLSPGIYLIHITDLQSKKMITRKLVKL